MDTSPFRQLISGLPGFHLRGKKETIVYVMQVYTYQVPHKF